MPLPPSSARPSRLRGLVASALLAILLVGVSAPVPAATAGQTVTGAALSWKWPVEGDHRVVRAFIAPATAYSAGHRGLDVAVPPGTVVVSPASGTVHFSGVVVDRPVVSIRHPDGVISSFEPVLSALADGTSVDRGSPIGIVQPGHCTGGCLHFGVRVHGEYVSPLVYLDGVPRAVLLPTRR